LVEFHILAHILGILMLLRLIHSRKSPVDFKMKTAKKKPPQWLRRLLMESQVWLIKELHIIAPVT